MIYFTYLDIAKKTQQIKERKKSLRKILMYQFTCSLIYVNAIPIDYRQKQNLRSYNLFFLAASEY